MTLQTRHDNQISLMMRGSSKNRTSIQITSDFNVLERGYSFGQQREYLNCFRKVDKYDVLQLAT